MSLALWTGFHDPFPMLPRVCEWGQKGGRGPPFPAEEEKDGQVMSDEQQIEPSNASSWPAKRRRDAALSAYALHP